MPAWIRRCDTGPTGMTSIRDATRLAESVPDAAGSCSQPQGHVDEAIQPGPSWCAFLPDLRQQLALEPLQHSMPQAGFARSASAAKPEPYGIRKTRSRSAAAAERHAGRSAAREEAHGRSFAICRQCRPTKPNLSFDGSIVEKRNSPARDWANASEFLFVTGCSASARFPAAPHASSKPPGTPASMRRRTTSNRRKAEMAGRSRE